MGSIPEFSVQRSRALRPRGLWASGGKRLFDVVLSATALLVLSPLLLALALWVRLDSPGPALYRQRRVGRYGREFVIHKFRTMVSDPRGQGALFTVTGASSWIASSVPFGPAHRQVLGPAERPTIRWPSRSAGRCGAAAPSR